MSVNFYPRSPRGERQHHPDGPEPTQKISIHAPREGSDVTVANRLTDRQNFYPRSPRGERQAQRTPVLFLRYFYPRSPRGERRLHHRAVDELTIISIHAPREGSDPNAFTAASTSSAISIHAPREGSDLLQMWFSADDEDFYPRSPRGERPDRADRGGTGRSYFYPRSPRGERRQKQTPTPREKEFLSTLPARGATAFARPILKFLKISIHAPREGSDLAATNVVFGR